MEPPYEWNLIPEWREPDMNITDQLLRIFPAKKADNNNNTLLHYISIKSDYIIKHFVKTGFIVNANNVKENDIDRDIAISEIIKILIENGIDINAKNNLSGNTALHRAVDNNDSVTVDLLLKAGANPNLLNNAGYTPLHLTLQDKKEISLAKIIIEAGADVNMLDPCGQNCVFNAARYASVELLNLLMDYKARFKIIADNGMGPLDYALMHWGHNKFLSDNMDKETSQNLDNYLILQYFYGKEKIEDQLECLEILFEQGLKINSNIKSNFSLLNTHFVSLNHTKIIRTLILKGAIVDFVLSEGQIDFGSSDFFSKTPKIFTRHAALCNSYKNGNGIVNFDFEKLNEEQKQYYQDCVKELQKLKNCLVYESMPLSNLIEGPVSSYYIFHKNLLEMFESGFIAKTYPICNDLLIEHYEYKQAKHELIVNATAGLQRLINFNNHSVDLIYHNILRYLSTKDRRIVASFVNTVTSESTSQQ